MSFSLPHIIGINLLLLFSCGNKDAKSNTAVVVTLPDQIELYNPYISNKIDSNYLYNSVYKMYTSVDVSCH